MKRLFALAVVVAAFLAPSVGHAAKPAHLAWYSCRLTLDRGLVTHSRCYTIPMVRRHPARTGWTIHRTRVSRHAEKSVRYPTFARPAKPAAIIPKNIPPRPSGTSMWLFVAGYCPGGGASGYMADGQWPYYGAVASNVLPFGTHVYIPSLGYSGVVADRGAPLDIYEPDCAATYALTGYRQVYVTYP